MGLDRAPRDREPEAGAARLRREERLEEVRQRVRRHTGAAVAYLERGGTVPVGDRDRECAWPGRLGGHGVERVLEQVDQHLAELLTVGARRDAVRQLQLERHAARLEAGAERLQRRPGQLAQIDRLEAEVLAAREAQQRGDLPLDALELAQDEAVLDGEGGGGLARELLREAPGGGHGVADLVRDARRQLADGGELLGVRERALDRDRAGEQLGRVEHGPSWSASASIAWSSSSLKVARRRSVRTSTWPHSRRGLTTGTIAITFASKRVSRSGRGRSRKRLFPIACGGRAPAQRCHAAASGASAKAPWVTASPLASRKEAPRSCMARASSASARRPHSGTPRSGESVRRKDWTSGQRRRLRRKTRRSIAARSHPCKGTRTRTTPRTAPRSSRRRSSASATRAPSACTPRTSPAVAAIMAAVVTNPRSVSARSRTTNGTATTRPAPACSSTEATRAGEAPSPASSRRVAPPSESAATVAATRANPRASAITSAEVASSSRPGCHAPERASRWTSHTVSAAIASR